MNSDELESKEKFLLNSLLTYFQNETNREIFISIVNETSSISLRILDWFVTNYSKDNSTKIIKSNFFNDFDVYNSYKSQLKAYNKKLFDPFCRKHSTKEKFNFYYEENKCVLTTTAQLNFFRWAIENKIIEYVQQNYDDIKMDLKERQKKNSTSSFSPCSDTSSPSSENKVLSYIVTFD